MESFGLESFDEYLQQANEGLLTIVQIETREALENADEIAKVPGIDVLFVGPYDLGNNIGHPIINGEMHEELVEAVAKVRDVAKKNNKAIGIYSTDGEQARVFADQGFQMVNTNVIREARANTRSGLSGRRHDRTPSLLQSSSS